MRVRDSLLMRRHFKRTLKSSANRAKRLGEEGTASAGHLRGGWRGQGLRAAGTQSLQDSVRTLDFVEGVTGSRWAGDLHDPPPRATPCPGEAAAAAQGGGRRGA